MQRQVFLVTVFMILYCYGVAHAESYAIRVPEGNVYQPFFVQSPNGIWSGLSVELVEALFAEAGVEPMYVKMPFARGLQGLKRGDVDVMLNLTITDERSEFINFIGPQLDETIYLVVKKRSGFSIATLDDIKKLPRPIGIERGKVYSKNFEQKRANDIDFRAHLDVVSEIDTNEKKLKAGRISGFLGYGYNVFHQIRTNPAYDGFTVYPRALNKDWVYFGFSKKSVSKKELNNFQKAYDRLIAQGMFEAIKSKYSLGYQIEVE